jgi:polyhydroxybutyrate depolymerase
MLSKHHTIRGPRLRDTRMLVLGVCALWAIGGATLAGAQLETRPLSHNGYSRPYVIYRPEHLSSHPAVVFMLGGIRSTAQSTSQDFGWIPEADRNGFIVVFPEPVATRPRDPTDRKDNVTFWEMNGSRTHQSGQGMMPVDDDGYLMAVLYQVLHHDHPDRKRIFFAGFSSGSGMVQLFASRHPKEVSAIVAVATPLMDPPSRIVRPVPILYMHGDDDEQLSGFEIHRPNFATTPHGNWLTWGYLDGCHIQTAEKTNWGVQFVWQDCKSHAIVVGDFVANLAHEWEGSLDSRDNPARPLKSHLNFTDMAWQFFAECSHQRT